MDQNYQQRLNEEGAILIILNLPEGTEFGIDMQPWNVGNRFKGIKMIPPGLHFIYYSAVSKQGETAPRTGFFHYFEAKEILIKKYNAAEEDLYDEEDEQTTERLKLNMREIDRSLGPYPLDLWTKWISFTQHIDKENMKRLVPLSEKICSAPELINTNVHGDSSVTARSSSVDMPPKETEKKQDINDQENSVVDEVPKHCAETSCAHPESTESNQNSSEDTNLSKTSKPTLPAMIIRPGTEIRFTEFPNKPYKEGATPSEVSRGSIDSSYTMNFILEKLNRPENMIAELQFSFICFLVGQVWDGWEHWRRLVVGLCKAEETLLQNPTLYQDFLSVLHYQVEEVPEDLFADIVENKNFLVTSLRVLFANIFDNASSLPSSLVLKANKFQKHLKSKFKWNLELEEDDDDLPVVVEL